MKTIRTEWHFTTEQIKAQVEAATGRRVSHVFRASGLYASITFADGGKATAYDGQPLRLQ